MVMSPSGFGFGAGFPNALDRAPWLPVDTS
jgi:hypothetical protein